MTDQLGQAVIELVRTARQQALDRVSQAHLDDAARRLGQPVRLAVAGRLKAGKSTLLNALIGEELAPTDAGECTRLVTWYVGADAPAVLVHLRDGHRSLRPYRRDGGPLDIDLGHPAEEIDHLEVRWPSARLRQITLIDTPGLGSLSQEVSARTEALLPEGSDRTPTADAVIYLLRHAHAGDLRFLDALRDETWAQGSPTNVIGVLSRADEIGSCRLDALQVAERVAARYRDDPRLRRLCPVVLPFAGLLAQTAVTLREQEFRVLAGLARLPQALAADLMLTADRFARDDRGIEVAVPDRRQVLQRLGLFGVRYTVEAIRRREVSSAQELAVLLTRSSGLEDLRTVVLAQFGQRARLLTCRSALSTVRAVVRRGGVAEPDLLAARHEEIVSSAHEFVEVRLLDDLHLGTLAVPPQVAEDLRRLLGGSGHAPAARLGLPAGTTGDALRQPVLAALARWQRLSESPAADQGLRRAARVAVRTCEGLLASG